MIQDRYITVSDHSPEWLEIYQIAQKDRGHPLWRNYQDIKVADYESMIVNMRDGVPAAFHGIYNRGRWPENVARICNRAYINPYFRDLGQGLEITWKNIKFVLDNYERWNRDVLFISRGVQYGDVEISWRKFQKFCDFISKKTGYPLTFDGYLYQCCANETRDCYQFCLWYDPKSIKHTLSMPKITRNQWLKLS